jgi:hypothetical protein
MLDAKYPRRNFRQPEFGELIRNSEHLFEELLKHKA